MNILLNSRKISLQILMAAVAIWSLGQGQSAVAMPPAPYHLIYGLVRDQYGTPLSSSSSLVILQAQSGTQLTAQFLPGFAAGINYQIKVPMDSGQTPVLYRPDALIESNEFTMLVTVGTTTNIPIEMTNFVMLGQPGGSTRIDLTLGVDSNGDGIPDAWENAYLTALGTNIPLSSINANSILAGGLTLWQAYLQGLPVFDPGVPFRVTLIGFDGTYPVIAFPAMTGRSYTVLGSSDLNTWTPLLFNLPTDAPGAPARSFFYSSTIQNVELQVSPPAPATNATYLKLLLQ